MKTVKLFYLGFWSDFSNENNMFTNILKKRYNVEIDPVNPDFLICSPLCPPFQYMKYDCPRIMYTGEFISPDFTAIDYFIGFDDIQFGDRCLRFPLFLYNVSGSSNSLKPLTKDEAFKELKSKEYFCNYIFGHDTALGIREKILEQLQEYKRVECAGTHRNNMPNGETYNYHTKHQLMRKCKFTIAAESVCYPGFTSEKIGHAYDAYTVPIYFGDPDITKDFNDKSFINCGNIENAIKKVIELDNNDELYIETLCQYRYNITDYENVMYKKLEDFLYNIFDQDKESAYRRPRFYRSYHHESYLKDYSNLQTKISYKLYKKFGI